MVYHCEGGTNTALRVNTELSSAMLRTGALCDYRGSLLTRAAAQICHVHRLTDRCVPANVKTHFTHFCRTDNAKKLVYSQFLYEALKGGGRCDSVAVRP